MIIQGHVQNGVIVPDTPTELQEGAAVRIELLPAGPPEPRPRRQGGQWRGRVHIADDFDALPPDLAEAFGATRS
jgi:hypothetical protein